MAVAGSKDPVAVASRPRPSSAPRKPFRDNTRLILFGILVLLGVLAALLTLARMVHDADFPDATDPVPEAAGLRAVSSGFPLVTRDDHETIERASFVYDALYAALKSRAR